MAATRVGKIVLKNSALFVCDMQEKFRPMISFYPQIINVAGRLLGAAQALDMPVIVTEQYPKGRMLKFEVRGVGIYIEST
ncbi:isochorismatase domain-containing protein 2 [Plakobranchus ocellatus]|uniref:Isochorismatase domain-containing protein 2 n=1 Tax=Plakobranchus ocellatus TaxID=259542 RepID=A0AAV4D629_9GAST|nr:isochorismatase domain-containing protein 2 [Plakobranchus ocellatus]